MKLSRRRFLKDTAAVTTAFLGLQKYASEPLHAAQRGRSEIDVYGELLSDPQRILDLPKDFSYTVISGTGDVMSDELRTPGAPDGMAAFPGPNGKTILVRNHEIQSGTTFEGAFGLRNEHLAKIDPAKLYDNARGKTPNLGGTTTLIYDVEHRQVHRHFLSLAGTRRNCAGGPTPWNTWITCEEDVTKAATEEELEGGINFNEKDHGYNFEVPATADQHLTDPVPLKAMGRFNHEAVAVDPKSGVVYQTEDRHDGIFFRFVPTENGKLAKGGRLQALAIRGKKSLDTRNWHSTGEPKIDVGQRMDVEWVDIENVESPEDDLRFQGFEEKGAARFARGEGLWYGRRELYFVCTNGGIAERGQIFRYVPSPYEATPQETSYPGQLELFIEPNDSTLLDHCDNVTVAPWGDLIVCEDGAFEQYLRGVTTDGKVYTIAHNRYVGQSELCGACFAPHHPTLFLNIQRPGFTLAITGPWGKNPDVARKRTL